MSKTCNCGSGSRNLIYSCSGAANTGYLADSVSRKLSGTEFGKMTCLSAVGAELSGFIDSANIADKNIVIDGCSVACGKLIFEKHSLPYEHYILTDFDVEKGITVIDESIIKRVTDELKIKIG